MSMGAPPRAAAVVRAVPAELSLLAVRGSVEVQAVAQVQGAAPAQVVAQARGAAPAQVVLVAPAAREGPEVLGEVLFASRVRRS
jgi:hypothetical protein